MTTVAFIGLGKMGRGMAARLIQTGHELRVFNRTRSKADELGRAGAVICSSPREACAGAHAVIAMTADDVSSRAVWLGPDGALAHRGAGASKAPIYPGEQEHCPMLPHVAMNWAQRLKRVFGVELEACARCGGRLQIIASIEEPQLIAKILSHLERAAPGQYQAELPRGARAPPPQARLI